jgi:hypothetical protein
MQGMMPSVADITSYFTKLSVENRMSTLSFHIIGWFIKVSNSWDVTFLLFTKNITMIIDVNWCVVQGLFVFLSLQNRGYNNYIMLFGQLSQELHTLSLDWLWKLYPRISLSCAHKKRSVKYLLQTNNISTFLSS